jgi:hypothetical protein
MGQKKMDNFTDSDFRILSFLGSIPVDSGLTAFASFKKYHAALEAKHPHIMVDLIKWVLIKISTDAKKTAIAFPDEDIFLEYNVRLVPIKHGSTGAVSNVRIEIPEPLPGKKGLVESLTRLAELAPSPFVTWILYCIQSNSYEVKEGEELV